MTLPTSLVLDGGLATQLEAQGEDLSSSLWSAAVLRSDPEAITRAHAAFFAAGAQVATTATYQLTPMSLSRSGFDEAELAPLTRDAVAAARSARDAHGSGWIVGSVGPYGASLADGSEYRGDYGLSVAELRAWHRPRLQKLAAAEPDLLACETIPCLAEVEALAAELADLGVPAWISLTTVGDRTRLGEPAREAYAIAADVPNVIALGANCCDPGESADVVAAVGGLRPVVFYPNSGESWDATARTWTGAAAASENVCAWLAAGVRALGGCCRVTPDQIAAMRRHL